MKKLMKNLLVIVVAVAIIAIFNVNAYSQEIFVNQKIVNKHKHQIESIGLSESVLNSKVFLLSLNEFDSKTATANNIASNKSIGKFKDLISLVFEIPGVKITGIKYENTVGINVTPPNQQSVGYLFYPTNNGGLFLHYCVDNGRVVKLNQGELWIASETFTEMIKAGERCSRGLCK